MKESSRAALLSAVMLIYSLIKSATNFRGHCLFDQTNLKNNHKMHSIQLLTKNVHTELTQVRVDAVIPTLFWSTQHVYDKLSFGIQ